MSHQALRANQIGEDIGTNMMIAPRELELKVDLNESDVDRLRDELDESTVGNKGGHKKLRTVYFDTPAHDLRAAGLSLRLRRENGNWLQTVKADQKVAGGLSNPLELECTVKVEEPDLTKIADKKIRRAVQRATKGAALRPVFETVVQRTTRMTAADGSQIEVAIDEGEVRAGAERRELREAELELKSGSAQGLLLAAEKLLKGHQLRMGERSKAERGYQLAVGEKGISTEPQKGSTPHLSRKETCAEAFSAILAATTQQIVANRKVVLETDDPQGAHQLRVGLRRLRSALRALRPLVDTSSLKAFDRSARDIGRCVGTLRDADVLISGIHAPMESAASDKDGFSELYELLVQDRVVKRDEVRVVLEGRDWTRLQLYLSIWPHMLEEIDGLEQSIVKHARKALRKAWKKASTYGSELDRASPERRHELRKALKKLRYMAEFFTPLFDKSQTAKFVKRLKTMQHVLGYLNDVRMAPRLEAVRERHHGDMEAAKVAAYIIGRHDAEAQHVWSQADKAWKALAASPRFWA
jgi:triphosphatase